MRGPLVVVGDVLADADIEGAVTRVAPDAPVPVLDEERMVRRAGGAGLAATLAAQHGEVVLIAATGDDGAGAAVRAGLAEAGVELVDLGLHGPTPEKIRVRAAGQSLLRIDRGSAPAAFGVLPERAAALLGSAAAVLVADYGRGLAADAAVRDALEGQRRVVWDPHRRGAAPVRGVALATLNREEAGHITELGPAAGLAGAAAQAELLVRRWQARAVAVTLGADGAFVSTGDGPPLVVPGLEVTALDVCGAGDAFAAAAARALADDAVVSEAVVAAVTAAGRHVAGLPAPALSRDDSEGAGAGAAAANAATAAIGHEAAEAVLAGIRARGGTIVATGGCFDLLHAGHASLLDAARCLGDALVVCLNSGASVRRLKGPDRPLQTARDRAGLLLALRAVDAVVVFEEATPAAVLERLRPDVWVKGGDYAGGHLPESEALARWGGRTVLVPYLSGRSTSTLLTHARTTHAHTARDRTAPDRGAPRAR